MSKVSVFAFISLLLVMLADATAHAQSGVNDSLTITPYNMKILGYETYTPETMYRLANPQFAYVDLSLAVEQGYENQGNHLSPSGKLAMNFDFGIAGKVAGEIGENIYTSKIVIGFSGGYGGVGMNGNFGDGRSVVLGKYRLKGGKRTSRVSPKADSDHASGGSVLRDAVKECIASNLLAYELPLGAFHCLGIVLPGTVASANGHTFAVRAITVSEDPLRFAHFVLNPSAKEMGGQYERADRRRVEIAMKNIVEALPKPAGMDLRGKTEEEKFRIGIFEAIDRQAAQHAYAWAHKIFHGATSPSNAALDGRMFDWGTCQFLEGYALVQVVPDDGANGDPHLFLPYLWRDTRNSWLKTLPPNLLAALPSEEEWDHRFVSGYRLKQRTEMVRMAGTVEEIYPQLIKLPAAKALGKILVNIAMAGHDKPVLIYRGEVPPRGRYDLAKILSALSEGNLDSREDLENHLMTLIPETILRSELASQYQIVFRSQREAAARAFISEQGEAQYRALATEIRNRPMSEVFNLSESRGLEDLLRKFDLHKDINLIQKYMDSTIQKSRREFWDAAPFTIVLKEHIDARTGARVRETFNARSNTYQTVTIPLVVRKNELKNCEETLFQEAA
jgi:hypothetical protein